MQPAASVQVLVIDDDKDIRCSVRAALELEGYRVFEASDGRSGLEHLRAHPEPLVVLLDWLMPDEDGMQVLAAMAADAPVRHRHRFILMSASAREPAFQSLTPPASLYVRFLAKPFELDDLFMLIDEAVCVSIHAGGAENTA